MKTCHILLSTVMLAAVHFPPSLGQQEDKTRSCPGGWRQLGEKCYGFYEDKVDQATASDKCRQLGGSLAMPKTKAINDMLAELTGRAVTWIGVDDRVTEGVFLFADGSPPTYTNWDSGEPNDWSGPGEDCAEMNLHSYATWNDRHCGLRNKYICEKNAAAAQEATKPPPPALTTTTTTEITVKITPPTTSTRSTDCSSSPRLCANNEMCQKTVSGHRCVTVCTRGYQTDTTGSVCVDIDECKLTPSQCSFDNVHHKCVNTIGSYRCLCQSGYENIEPIICVESILSPKRPDELAEELLVAIQTIHWMARIFCVVVLILDLKMFVSILYRWVATEPVPEYETDDEAVAIPVVHTKPRFSASEGYVKEEGNAIEPNMSESEYE